MDFGNRKASHSCPSAIACIKAGAFDLGQPLHGWPAEFALKQQPDSPAAAHMQRPLQQHPETRSRCHLLLAPSANQNSGTY